MTGCLLSGLLAGFSFYVGRTFEPARVAVALFLLSSSLLLVLALRPAIEVHRDFLLIGDRRISWLDIERIDRTGWISPLVVRLTLAGGRRFILLYPGDPQSANRLLRQIRRFATRALIDGVPHRQYWGDKPVSAAVRALPAPRPRLLRHEDEAEVERLFRRLKTVGHLDSSNSGDETGP